MDSLQNLLPKFPPLGPWLLILSLADLGLRGVALWRSARANQNYWFIALLVFNTLGILPLAYLLIQKQNASKKTHH